MKKGKLLIKNAHQVVKVCGNYEKMLVGKEMREIDIFNSKNNNNLGVVVNR